MSHLAKHVTLASTERAKLCKIRAGKLHLGNEIACVSDLIEKMGEIEGVLGRAKQVRADILERCCVLKVLANGTEKKRVKRRSKKQTIKDAKAKKSQLLQSTVCH